MANLEGPLSKWTNVVNGWQYRWFVLDQNAGLLSYYTSKEKMMRGSRRGCVRLKGAVVGIDDEDDSTFTITVDQKTFHFQARDGDERERWISGLEETILRHAQPFRASQAAAESQGNFEKKLAEADSYLQILIDQVKSLSARIEQCQDESSQQKYIEIKMTAEEMIEGIKQSIVHLQICKQNLASPLLNGATIDASMVSAQAAQKSALPHMDSETGFDTFEDTQESLPLGAPGGASFAPDGTTFSEGKIPYTSYSSSDDDDFFDAEDLDPKTGNGDLPDGLEKHVAPCVITSENDYFDELYDDADEDELESLDQHGSIVTHLLSQVRIGMDLTKIVLPTFILERRSLLEMFADFLAHPDLFASITDAQTPRDRMVQCVRWYLSAFHAGRKSEVAKKPYNPIIGETFKCFWDLPDEPKTADLATEGPVPWATKNNVTMIAEQVSHHPPISAFYAEHHNRRISANGYVWTKSKFLGLSIGVHMIGQTVVSVLDHDEEYLLTFPSAYGRSILTVPWVELGGKTTISCPKTGYSANVNFLTKPFYGGKKNQITAEIFEPDDRKPFCTIQGEWSGTMWAKWSTGQNEKFVDIYSLPIIKKQVKPRDEQTEFESRRLWQEVTAALKQKNVELATAGKHKLEQRQREEARDRKEKGETWETKLFHELGEHWIFDYPLIKQLEKQRNRVLDAANAAAAAADAQNIETSSVTSQDLMTSLASDDRRSDDESTEQSDFFDDVGDTIPGEDIGSEVGV